MILHLVVNNATNNSGCAPGVSGSRACQVPVGDAAPRTTSRGDPTGTLKVRKELYRSLSGGWRLVKQSISNTVGQTDSFGLVGLPTVAAAAGQLQVYSDWFGNLQDRVFENLHGALKTAVWQGYALGATQARARAGKPLPGSLPGPGVVLASALQDLNGIVAATLQQSSRYFANSVLQKRKPQSTARGLNMIVDGVGVSRSGLLVSYAVVRAHAMGALDAYQALGVTQVGTIPESFPGRSFRDAARGETPVVLGRIKLRVPKPRPSARAVTQARRAERKLEQAFPNLVNVATAGDDRVCPVCERISEDGPYTLDKARTLIPAHPRCRCAFIPFVPEEVEVA